MTSETGGRLDVADAFDTYGPGLYEYAWTLLRDRRRAADAVVETLVAAQFHYARLDEPELLRGWFYALMRTLCLRQTRSYYEDDEPELLEEWTDRDEARLVIDSALGALPDEQYEIVDLFVRHELTTIELGRLLGLSPTEAGDILGRASTALEEAVEAVVIARAVPQTCPDIESDRGTDTLPVAKVRGLVRHVWSCAICRELRPNALPIQRLQEILPFSPPPEGLRAELVHLSGAPDASEARASIAARVEPLDERGWPYTLVVEEPIEAPPPEPVGRASRRSGLPAIAVIGGAVVLLAVIGGLALTSGGSRQAAASVPTTAGASSDSGSPDSSSPSGPGRTRKKSTKPTLTPTPTPSKHTASPSPSSTPTSKPPSSSGPAPTPPAGPAPSGSLQVSGCSMDSGQDTCTVTVRAVGGPVQWRVTGTSQHVKASGSGSLSSGQTTGVVVSHDWCWIGGGSGSVYFGSATASVSWSC
jgi:RNA polymerase sigma factor (sigma-70 family)